MIAEFPTVRSGSLLALALLLGAACAGDRPPAIAPVGPLSVTVGETLVVDLHASDPDGDPVRFEVAGAPAGAAVEPGTPWRFRYSPVATDAATGGKTWDLVFTARDGRGGEARDRVPLTVFPEGATPTFQGPFAWTLDLALEDRIVAVVRVRDDDTAALQFQLHKAIPGAAFEVADGHAAAVVWRPTPQQAAAGPLFTFTLGVSDGVHREVVRDFAILLVNPDLFGGCPGTAPTAWVDPPGDRRGPGTTRVEVHAADAESSVASVACWWSATGETDEGTMNRLDLKPAGDRWTGTLPDLSAAAGPGLAVAWHCRATDADDPTGRCNRATRLPKAGEFGFTAYASDGAPCREDDLHRGGVTPDLPAGRAEGLRACGEARFRFAVSKGQTLVARADARSASPGPVALEARLPGSTPTTGNGAVRATAGEDGEGLLVVRGQDLTYALEAAVRDDACATDRPAGVPAGARPLSPGGTEGALCPGDADRWTFDLAAGEAASLVLTFDPGAVDLDLAAGPAGAPGPDRLSAGTSGRERVVVEALGPGTFEARVGTADLRGAPYRLEFQVEGQEALCEDDFLAPNPDRDGAPVIPEGAWDLKLCPGRLDFVRLDLNGGESVSARVDVESGEAPPLALLGPQGETLASAPGGEATVEVSATADAAGPVFVRVGPGGALSLPYRLTYGATDEACHKDRLEPNDDPASPGALPGGFTTHLTLCGEDRDRFGFRLGAWEALRILALDGTAKPRVTLARPDPAADPDALGTATEWGEELTFVAPAPGTWILTVENAGPDGWYDLAVER